MRWQKFVKNLLNSLKVEDAVENSYKHYHAKGVQCVTLFKSEALHVKIYFIDTTDMEVANLHTHTIFNPHNNRHATDIMLLEGQIAVPTFSYAERAIQVEHPKRLNEAYNTHNKFVMTDVRENESKPTYQYDSVGNLSPLDNHFLSQSGEFVHIDAGVIFSYKINKEAGALIRILVVDYLSIGDAEPAMYSLDEKPHTNEGLFEQYTESDIIHVFNAIDGLCSK